MTFFVEGLQSSGKSTLAGLIFVKHPECRHLEEGDYSPVELAGCAYLDMAEYQRV